MQFRTCGIITCDIITDTLSTRHIKDAVRCQTSCRKKYTLTYTCNTDPHTHTHTHTHTHKHNPSANSSCLSLQTKPKPPLSQHGRLDAEEVTPNSNPGDGGWLVPHCAD